MSEIGRGSEADMYTLLATIPVQYQNLLVSLIYLWTASEIVEFV